MKKIIKLAKKFSKQLKKIAQQTREELILQIQNLLELNNITILLSRHDITSPLFINSLYPQKPKSDIAIKFLNSLSTEKLEELLVNLDSFEEKKKLPSDSDFILNINAPKSNDVKFRYLIKKDILELMLESDDSGGDIFYQNILNMPNVTPELEEKMINFFAKKNDKAKLVLIAGETSSPQTIEKLMFYPDAWVRAGLIGNKNLSRNHVLFLAEDEDQLVRWALLRSTENYYHPSKPYSIMVWQIFKDDKNPKIKELARKLLKMNNYNEETGESKEYSQTPLEEFDF